MTETYSLSSDFSNGLNPEQLRSEINSDNGIVPLCVTISNTGDVVNIIFDNGLSNDEKTTLSTLVGSHMANYNEPKTTFYVVEPTTTEIYSSSYQLVKKFKYGGINAIGNINYIEVISRMDKGVSSYSLRVTRGDTQEVIAEATGLTNTVSEINDLGLINNVPNTPKIFELHAKRSGGSGFKKLSKGVYIDEIIIYHDN